MVRKANERPWLCSQNSGCEINRENRNGCRACRLRLCLQAGMALGKIKLLTVYFVTEGLIVVFHREWDEKAKTVYSQRDCRINSFGPAICKTMDWIYCCSSRG